MDDTPLEKLIATICDTSDLTDDEVREELAAAGVDVDVAKARTMAKTDALLAERAVRLAIAAVKANPPLNPLPWREDDSVVRSANSNAVAQWAEWADAAHIATAVNAVPLLIAEVERLLPHAGEIAALADLHILCADAGIAPGHIVERVRSLTTALEAARVAVEKLPELHPERCANGFQCHCGARAANAARSEARRALGLEVGNG